MLRNRELGIPSEKKWLHDRTLHNIRNGNCYKTIFEEQEDTILTLYMRTVNENESFAITEDKNNRIKRWNLNTGECQWTFRPLGTGRGLLFFTDIAAIYQCEKGNGFLTHLIPLETGNSENRVAVTTKICISGNNIFEFKKDGMLKNGHFLPFDEPIEPINIPESERYVIDHERKTVYIYDRIQHKKTEIDLSNWVPNFHSIQCSFTAGHCQYFGLILRFKAAPLFCKIDLKSGGVDTYQLDNFRGDSTYSILIDNGIAFLGLSRHIVAFNLLTFKEKVIGEHDSHIEYLGLENGILISGSQNTSNKDGELKLWDVKTEELLKTMKFPEMRRVCISGKKVLALVDNYLMQWDYDTFHQGQVYTEKSLKEEPVINNSLQRQPDYYYEGGGGCATQ